MKYLVLALLILSFGCATTPSSGVVFVERPYYYETYTPPVYGGYYHHVTYVRPCPPRYVHKPICHNSHHNGRH